MPAVQELGELAEIDLFRDLSREQLSALNASLRRKNFPPGYNLITADQPGETVYVVLSGSVKVHTIQGDGIEVILTILGKGEVVGEMSLADSLGRSANVSTLEESTLLWMDGVTFRTCLREIPGMANNLVNVLSRRLRLANAHARSLAALDVQGRVASQLLAFAREYGEPAPDGDILIPLRLTQTDLAALVGASRVRVNQVLGYYKRHGHVSVASDHRITVRNTSALARHGQ